MKMETELSPSLTPKTLREILSIGNYVRDQVANEDDLNLDDEALNTLLILKEDTELALKGKVDSIAFVLDDLEATADQFKRRAQVNSLAAKRFENAAERLKTYLKGTMESHGLKEVVGTDERFALSPTAQRLIINDESKLPEQFIRQIIVKEPLKDKIKEALENLEEVPGARLEGGFAMKRFAVKPPKKPKKAKANEAS